jgi:hypothetical protein
MTGRAVQSGIMIVAAYPDTTRVLSRLGRTVSRPHSLLMSADEKGMAVVAGTMPCEPSHLVPS